MRALFVLLSLVLSSCVVLDSFPNRLVRSSVALVSLEDRAYCSGVAISRTRILTAQHCKVGMEYGIILVREEGKVATAAKIVLESEQADMMILEVEGADFTPARIGDPDALERGDTVYVVGSTYGDLEFSFAVGHVAYVNRKLSIGNYIQINAEVRGGNSGGPVYNSAGELVGILTKGDGAGIGLVVSISQAPLGIRSEIVG